MKRRVPPALRAIDLAAHAKGRRNEARALARVLDVVADLPWAFGARHADDTTEVVVVQDAFSDWRIDADIALALSALRARKAAA